MFGHQQRRAIKNRTMGRAEWRALTSTLRKLTRHETTKEQRRAAVFASELCTLARVGFGRFGWAMPAWDQVFPGLGYPEHGITRAALIRSALPQCIGRNR